MPEPSKIFSYCERGLDPSYWAEPFNAITNAAFLIAAILGLRAYLSLREGEKRWYQPTLILLVFAIGIGSYLFHTHAEPWSAAADMLPILLFIFVYLYTALTRFIGLSKWLTALILIGFIVLSGLTSVARCSDAMVLLDLSGDTRSPCLNGSAAYLPPLLAMFVISAVIWRKDRQRAGLLLLAGCIFAISVTLRTIDNATCPFTFIGNLQIGTHFLWHILNAVTLYLLLKAALISRPQHQNKREY